MTPRQSKEISNEPKPKSKWPMCHMTPMEVAGKKFLKKYGKSLSVQDVCDFLHNLGRKLRPVLVIVDEV